MKFEGRRSGRPASSRQPATVSESFAMISARLYRIEVRERLLGDQDAAFSGPVEIEDDDQREGEQQREQADRCPAQPAVRRRDLAQHEDGEQHIRAAAR
ncbi:hypothetical protein [Sphingomonas sp. dw_22]|uniref:hypothetical protein n=1 Tax=Sphingomonas sp. dw_22 TaxID=2721175 RepID=UPI001BD21A94|nr:hypothetical protein [Sphingomonas sp. dw_22]